MSVIKQEFDIFDIYIEPDRKVITIRQRWKYNWVPSSVFTMWTYEEKKKFHDAVDNVIWQQWSGNYFAVSRVDPIEKKKSKDRTYDNARFAINFDIEWVTSNQHWTANVEKKFLDDTFQSRVVHSSNEVYLSSNDIFTTYNSFGCNEYNNVVSHEFGHMIDNSDEYGEEYMWPEDLLYYQNNPLKRSSRLRHSDDYYSRMNIGNQLRNRFINAIDDHLDKMVPGVNFIALLTNKYMKSINK